MNQERRKLIQLAIDKISEARSMLETARDEEQNYLDVMPEGLQSGDNGTKAQEAINGLDEVIDELDSLASTAILLME